MFSCTADVSVTRSGACHPAPKFSLVSTYLWVSPPDLRVLLHFSIKCCNFLYIGVARPLVVFCICPMMQFSATLNLHRISIDNIIKNVKTKIKHTHTSNQLCPYSFLPLKKSTGTISISLINLYSGIL